MKRVLQVVTLATPGNDYGGPLRVAVNQSKFLRKLGYHVDLIAARDGFEFGASDILFDGEIVQTFRSLHPLGRGRFAFYFSPSMVMWLAKNIRVYDLVHFHFARDLVIIPATLVAMANRMPTILQTHGMVLSSSRPAIKWVDRVFTRHLLAYSSRVLSLAEDETKNLRAIQPSIRVAHLPNGIHAGSRDSLQEKKNQVLFLARLHSRKRPLVFVEIARRLAPVFPNTRFLLAGPDAGEGNAVTDAIGALNLGTQLEWIGPVPPERTQTLFDESIIYVLPAVGEIFPMTILEAFKSRTAVVSTDDMFIAGLLDHEDAALVTGADIDEMASAVESLLRSPELRDRIARRGESLVQNSLSIEAVVGELSNIYGTSLKERDK
jgi:glycosyltransferase involved in cell wall biosynthesis